MRLFLFIVLFLQAFLIDAQNPPTAAIIRDFIFEGNLKTKADVLTREFTFGIGDTMPLSKLALKLEENRLRLLNTNLFTEVKINLKNWTLDDKVSIIISVKERWYFYPVPIFEIADRDFNVWWKEHHHDLRRSNYGIRLTHGNISGRRDPFSTLIQFGYTPKFSLGYSLPYLNKKQTIGAFLGAFYATNREIGYTTDSNRVIFYKNPTTPIYTRFSYNVGINYSPGLFDRFLWTAGYSKQTLDTSVTERNQDFFLNRSTTQNYFWLSFDYSNDTRDFKPLPTKGHLMSLNVNKLGFSPQDNVNALDLTVRWAQYFKLHQKWTLETIARGKTALIRQRQPYNVLRAIGYNSDYLHGYELFVVDGYDYGVLKNSLKFEFMNKNYDLTRTAIKNRVFNSFTDFKLQLFLTGNLDFGYVYTPQYNPSNNFNNRLLYGGGIGLDILAYHGLLWQLEYSFNHTGQGGFYVHYKTNF